MDKPMTFEEWWIMHAESCKPYSLSSFQHECARSAWKARDAELDALRKENQLMRDSIKQAIVYMETDNPGNSFRLMCLNVLRESSTKQ